MGTGQRGSIFVRFGGHQNFRLTPASRFRKVAVMLKAIHAQEDREAARVKVRMVTEKLKQLKLEKAAALVEGGAEETFSYYDFPPTHWRSIRTNNPPERINRELRRRTGVVGNFPDGRSALMLVCAGLRYIAGHKWGTERYLNMRPLYQACLLTIPRLRGILRRGHGAPKMIRRRGILMRRSLMSGQNS